MGKKRKKHGKGASCYRFEREHRMEWIKRAFKPLLSFMGKDLKYRDVLNNYVTVEKIDE